MRLKFSRSHLCNKQCRQLIIIFIKLCLFVNVETTLESADFKKNLPAKVVWGLLGKDVELPCDVTPPTPTDAVKMIFWYKDTAGMPLYSLDARGGPLIEASHLATTDGLGSRSYFIADDHPSKARLHIQHVTSDDEGIFRCRVDFLNSPTRNFQVNLTLVVQPSQPRIFDAEGKEVIADAGPFLEGLKLFLSCEVNGGRPRPSVNWWHNGTILDSVVDTKDGAYTTVNQLVINSLPRTFWGNRLECRASSSDISDDLIRQVQLKVYLKPTKVKIVTDINLLSVNKAHVVRCETSGSYPPAKLSWSLNGEAIGNAIFTDETTEFYTTSILTLNVKAADDGKYLVCRADNPRYPGGSTEDRRQIHVAYPPKVAVRSESGVSSSVKEGTNVVLKCETSARPEPYSYNWYYDEHIIRGNESSGVLLRENVLELSKVTKSSDGQYSCAAANTEGITYSTPFSLNIQYAPRCAKGYEVIRVGVISHEAITVDCHVDALPVKTRFWWTYNTSKGVLPVQGARQHDEDGVSTLQFTPGSTEFESLACWATNSIGRQENPCLFYVIPAGYPESPRSCLLRNTTSRGLEVACIAGQGGGLPQSFVLEVSDISIPDEPPSVTTLSDQGERPLPIYRVYGEIPIFRLHSLQPGREYQLLVYAENAKGRSEPPVVMSKVKVEIPVDTLQENAPTLILTRQLEDSPPATESLTLILLLLTAVGTLLIVSIITAATVLACRKRPAVVIRQRTVRRKPPDDMELSEAGFNEGFHRRSALYRATLYEQEMDRNSRQVTVPPSSSASKHKNGMEKETVVNLTPFLPAPTLPPDFLNIMDIDDSCYSSHLTVETNNDLTDFSPTNNKSSEEISTEVINSTTSLTTSQWAHVLNSDDSCADKDYLPEEGESDSSDDDTNLLLLQRRNMSSKNVLSVRNQDSTTAKQILPGTDIAGPSRSSPVHKEKTKDHVEKPLKKWSRTIRKERTAKINTGKSYVNVNGPDLIMTPTSFLPQTTEY